MPTLNISHNSDDYKELKSSEWPERESGGCNKFAGVIIPGRIESAVDAEKA
jgi:hypothetical protein